MKKALEINPNYADAHNNLGIAMQGLNNFLKALSCYEKAIEIKPIFPQAYHNLGLIFYKLGKIEKAKNCYEKALKISPDYADAHNNLGIVFKELGNFEEAINCYEKATQYKSENLVYFYHLSEIKKEILNSNLKNKINKILGSINCSKKNLAYGNFLLSNYELENKNYENEFNFLLKGHFYYFESEKEKFDNEVKYWLNILPQAKQLINLNKSNNKIKKDNFNLRPIFIIGVPRCGSTLVEKIVASGAKNIPIGEEKNIIGNIVKDLIYRDHSSILDIKNIQTNIYEKYSQNGLAQKKNNYIFTDKSLDNFFYLDLIKEIFPNAKVINCRRNTLSSIMSIIKNNLVDVPWAHNIEHIFKYFDIYYHSIENSKKKFSKFIYELQYESFVDNPEMESKKLLKFCDLPWDKKCLEFYKRSELASKTASNIQIRKPIYKDSINKYLPYKQFLNKYGNEYSWFTKK